MKKDFIFHQYFKKEKFIDRKNTSIEDDIDVIIPIKNTNKLFEKNLYSIYKEIPVHRLFIGNGGCTDNSLEILKKFPRVEIIDQTKYKTLGFCIAELISLVKTEWFIYLHSDVYIPENWYDIMKINQSNYGWFESDSRVTTLVNFDRGIKRMERSYSGGQMGKKEVFKDIIPTIEDDYIYRNEDIIFRELIEQEGFKYGRVLDTHYYHQIMNKKGDEVPEFERIDIKWIEDKQWKIKTFLKQLKGIIKYVAPKPVDYLIESVNTPLNALKWYKAINLYEFTKWVEKTNKGWLKYLDISEEEKIPEPIPTTIQKVYKKLRDMLNPLIKKLDSLINPRK